MGRHEADAICRSAARGERRRVIAVIAASGSGAPRVVAAHGSVLGRGTRTEQPAAADGERYRAEVAGVAAWGTRRLELAVEHGDQRRRHVRYLTSMAGVAIAWCCWLAYVAFAFWWLSRIGAYAALAGFGVSAVSLGLPWLLAWWKPEVGALGQLTRVWELALAAVVVLAVVTIAVPRLVLVDVVDHGKQSTHWWFDVPAGAVRSDAPGPRGLPHYDISDPVTTYAMPLAAPCAGTLTAPLAWQKAPPLVFDADVVTPTMKVTAGDATATLSGVTCTGPLAVPVAAGAVHVELGGTGTLDCNASAARVVAISISPAQRSLVVHSAGVDSTWTTATPTERARACVGTGPLQIDVATFESLSTPQAISQIGATPFACDGRDVRTIALTNVPATATRAGLVVLPGDRAIVCDPEAGAVTIDGRSCQLTLASLGCAAPARDCYFVGNAASSASSRKVGSTCKALDDHLDADAVARGNVPSSCKGARIFRCAP